MPLFQQAAERGHSKSQMRLASLYAQGQGVPQDQVLAYMWFTLAATRTEPGRERAQARKLQEQTERRMTPEQLARAQERVRAWEPQQTQKSCTF